AIALALRVLSFAMPLRITFADREPQNLERVLVRIFEVEGFDSSRILVPLGQRLRTIGCVFYLVLSEPLICFVHVRHNERNVLKPTIVAPRIDRDRPALWRQIFSQFDRLISELHANDPRSDSE